ncbi:MAG: DNA internalization-related competence protein ComEC/Rec2, partial [Nitrospirae bacterium]
TILKLLAVPLVAFLGTLPLTVFYFHKIPLLSVPMNLIITPIVCFILMPLSILSSLMYLITGLWPLTALTEHLARAVLRIVYSISSFPHIVIPVRALPVALIISVYLFLFALSIRKRSLTVFASILIGLSLVFSTGLYEFKKPMVTFLDVGQGDSAVVETSDNKTIVIDTGNTGRETAAYLSYRGINTIDALVLTHADQDHSGGFYRLIDYFRVKELWDNGELRYSRLPQGIRHRSLLAGTVLKADKSSFQVLHPFRGYYSIKGSERNNHSLVMKFSDEPLSVLFTGDAEEDAEKTMLAYKNLLRARLLKVSHHGSHTATTRAFLYALSPEVAVISVGRHNRYGHPHRDVLIRLAPYRLFRTDLHGSIRIYKKDTNTFSVATYSDMALRDIIPDYSPLEELKNL